MSTENECIDDLTEATSRSYGFSHGRPHLIAARRISKNQVHSNDGARAIAASVSGWAAPNDISNNSIREGV